MRTLKNYSILLIVFLLSPFFLITYTQAKEIPTQIAGIVLGSDVKKYPYLTESNFMKEVVVTDFHGFRKGIISYGTCHHIDEILKIDLKYEERGKDFYDKLLKKFRQKFGEADHWKGDSFGLVHVWKWYFTDKEQNRISLILQHNSKNSSETIGNMVKLAFPEKIEEERLCFSDKCQENYQRISKETQEEMKQTGPSYFIPN